MNDDIYLSISNPRLQALARLGTKRQYRKNTVLIEEGDQGSTILIVLEGRLKAFSRGNPEGSNREVTFGVYGVGEVVGEMSLDDGPRSASVATLEASICSVVTKETVRNFIKVEPDFAFDLLARVITRARQATLNARNLVMTDAYGRLTELLSTEAVESSDGTSIMPNKMPHHEIASRIGCSREMVSRLMKDLEKGAYITQNSEKRLVLLRPLPARW